jgi:hypothetical protein
MKQEAGKARTAQKKTAATTATGTATAGSAGFAVDWSQTGGKVALTCFIAAIVLIAFYYARQTLIHSQRAAAYAAA